ncbi:MAG: bifunctional phosphopantothenoylcysteine decarboxylase/phosphopantothenate--cysteine ligase CoaBC [Chloroflexi bacterium]|nr:bifunctional phosphopantothenoylcysteine decarboxylase/phosphopantothenate--cysteine ligase CoaBC [Chloroflexota bacterium]
MIPVLDKKHIVLGVTGSIACYKALDLASKLTQGGALVDVVMTQSATRFVTPLAFGGITHQPVVTDLFDPQSELSVEHVALAERADLLVVAPATANSIAKMALGLADDPLTTTLLATMAPVIVAPAMDGHMYENAAVQENLKKLRDRGVTIVGPDEGYLASGKMGKGRLVETPELMGHIRAILGKDGDLAGSTIVVSAGGTQEPLDPARIITNHSSGKMGYALAEAARDRGARTILVTAPTSLPDPVAVEVVRVQTALEMRDQVVKATADAQALVMAAAVADYRPRLASPQKLKKDSDSMTLELTRNPDILTETTGPIVKVGFAAESQDLAQNAREKMARKGLDLIVANDITDPESGFGSDANKVLILGKNGQVEDLPLMPKEAVAHRVLDRVRDLMAAEKG